LSLLIDLSQEMGLCSNLFKSLLRLSLVVFFFEVLSAQSLQPGNTFKIML